MTWIIRALLFVGGSIAGWFVATDSSVYPVASFIAALLLITLFVSLWAFWPNLCRFLRNTTRKDAH